MGISASIIDKKVECMDSEVYGNILEIYFANIDDDTSSVETCVNGYSKLRVRIIGCLAPRLQRTITETTMISEI